MSWALVTGGALRLGRAICLALADAGHHVLVHYRSSEQSAQELVKTLLAKGVQARSIQGDFSSPLLVDRFLQELERHDLAVDLVVNNVGEYLIAPLADTTPAQWEALFQVNLHAPMAIVHHLLPRLKEAQGQIINLGASGLEGPRASLHSPAYRLTKLALLGWSRSLAKELAPSQVRVNMISPGRLNNSEDLTPDRLQAIPAGRAGTPEEVAEVIRWLVGPENGYITGQNIEVAGGLSL